MYKSKISLNKKMQSTQYYTLSFDVTFEHHNDVCSFSLLPPYSYSRLTNFLKSSEEGCRERRDINFEMKTIAYTLANTQVPYVTISGRQPSKKNILIMARQHPGEVWSSFLAEALIKELLRESKGECEWLLRHFTFRVVPMVNIDGVTYGNFRCDLGGNDLNRSWRYPNKVLHPQILPITQEVSRLAKEEEVVCCLDLHAHSKDLGVFAYCCKPDAQGRLLPLLISRATPLFLFPSCTYGVSNYKKTTARAIINEITNADHVLTIEASFYATPTKLLHPASFISVAIAILKALHQYHSQSEELHKAKQELPKAMAEAAAMRNNINQNDEEESGSDSEPDCD